MTTPACPTCHERHGPLVDCQGQPIDWAARQQRARAWTYRPRKRNQDFYAGYLEMSLEAGK